MPGAKAQTPAPIDRPLSRAYLREFGGWSTAYPPGVSEPTTLRLMENVQINRDGSCRVRPGLRYLSYDTTPDADTGTGGTSSWPTTSAVGSHESFFLADGTKAYLYAMREVDLTVGFRVLVSSPAGFMETSLIDAGFVIEQGEATLRFTEATTYVKYLQINNKIFALSNAGEAMRMFFVGEDKLAKRLSSIERPYWDVDDKLTVVHPDAAWINSGVPTGVRTNLVLNPGFEASVADWVAGNTLTTFERSDDFARTGTYSVKLSSKPTRTNLVPNPLQDATTYGTVAWAAGVGADDTALQVVSGRARVHVNANAEKGLAYSRAMDVLPSTSYKMAFDSTGGAFLRVDELRCVVRYFDANGVKIGGDITLTTGNGPGGLVTSGSFTTPSSCQSLKMCVQGIRDTATSQTAEAYFDFKNAIVVRSTESTTFFSGASGANYFWEGTTAQSSSVYHPPQDIGITTTIASGAGDYALSVYGRAGTTVRNVSARFYAGTAASTTPVDSDAGTPTADGSGAWVRSTNTSTASASTTWVKADLLIQAVPRGEFHYLDNVLFEKSTTVDAYFDGSTPNISGVTYTWSGTANASTSVESTFSVGLTNPPAETKTVNTLIDSVAADNAYSVGFFYTLSNEVGESAVSQVTVVRVQRPWSGWLWQSPNGAGEPSGTETLDPAACADQLAAYMPSGVFADAIAAGAIKWSLYAFTWSDQDPTPVTALKVATRALNGASVYGEDSWLRMTPAQSEASSEVSAVPALNTRFNSSDPSRGAQGVVAGDRMILVYDPVDQAVIKWSSNQQGSYHDFSPSKGGGYKTLTSGNLQVPAVVKLWQNPQSADTLTILCLGVDGYSTGYYMAPAEISSQSESISIMAFEETTATPGTCSPYGVEVLNNALYHPIEEHLMKSTASNYNINHMSLSDTIENMWKKLDSKRHIVSCQLDNRIYFLVNNPEGTVLEAGCWGNEVWVFDAAQKTGTWSRWLTPGQSLRKIEQNGRIVMSLVHPSGIFYFDEQAVLDDYVDIADSEVKSRDIPWLLETNTQGANRAHDAPAHLRQVSIMLGNFLGQLRYGVRGWDLEGKAVDVSKIVRDQGSASTFTWDLEDFLTIRKNMKEWFFYAESVEEEGVLQHSEGQISVVQYRYTPVSVNDGYAHGQVETFEYGRASAAADVRTTDSGVPMPYIDTRRP